MAATQPSLHNFYKSRKSARETTLKNVKGSVVRDADVVESVISEVSVEKNVVNEKVPRDAIATRRPTRPAAKTSSRKTQVKKPVQGTQDILTALRKVSEKAEAKASEKAEEATTVKSLQSVNVTPPITPKRKKEEEEEETKRKRRKQDNGEEELDRTPGGMVKDLPAPPAPRSAKKKLVMSSEAEGTQEKKLTPAEIKERLGKCGRLDQLRAKLLKVNKCEEKLKQFKESTIAESLPPVVPASPAKSKEHPQLAKFSSIEVHVPISPRKTPVKTPSKTPLKAPAHERFQHLVEKPSEELVLPYKYRFLKDMFRAVDTVVSLLHNRHEVISYSKLKPAVQEMMRRAFEERHLGQIKTIFPLAYIFKQERRNKKNVVSNDVSKGSYELTVTSNMDYKSVSASQNLMSKFDSAPAENFPKFRKMDSVVLVERRNIFHNALINIVRDHHSEFLMTLEPPISSVGAIKRWHPEFALEDLPDIEEAPLPQPPTMEKLGTARDVLDKAQDLFSLNHRLEKAVTDAAEQTPAPVAKTAPSLSAAPVNTCLALKGVSSSLLEKIRAREAAKAAREMTRSCGENKELEMLSRLPEISRIIRNTFVTEKKAALPWEVVAAKVAASYTSMLGGNEVDSHLELLIKEIPGWCTVHNVRSGRFLKINKNEQLCSVEEKLQALIKQRK
ncbi:DNA replication factor Cdt1 [Penaeus vannamei]|uniref:DNA replication factor Cdt1 n=1 Tax=Penaeus vannamei TaxID=6689 RepID=UPI00387F7C6D